MKKEKEERKGYSPTPATPHTATVRAAQRTMEGTRLIVWGCPSPGPLPREPKKKGEEVVVCSGECLISTGVA